MQKKSLAVVSANVADGNSQAILLQQALSAMNIDCEIYRSQTQQTLVDKMRTSLGNYDAIIAIGGDGLLHSVVNAMMQNGDKTPVAVIPAGTSNSFAYTVGLTCIADTAQAIFSNSLRQIDLADFTLNNRQFFSISIIHCGVPVFGARISERLRSLGKIRYKLGALLAAMFAPNRKLTVVLDGDSIECASLMVQLTYGPALSKTSRTLLAPNLDLSDGKLDVILAGKLSILQRLEFFKRCQTGRHVHMQQVTCRKAESIILETAVGTVLNVDGEFVRTEQNSLEIRVRPRALNAFVKSETL
jgi:diacylglycerol kinase (ATP)